MDRIKKLTAVCAAAGLTALVAAPAGAIVPPRDCGKITVKGKRYNIKADQLRCPTARRYAEAYLRSGTRPRYYRCERGSGRITVRCVAARYNPDRTFWAIKR